jgi:hypothetical protein
MNELLTEKYNAAKGLHEPILRETVSDEIAAQLIELEKPKVPIDGFYRHTLDTPTVSIIWGSACADILGFLASSKSPPKEETSEDADKL